MEKYTEIDEQMRSIFVPYEIYKKSVDNGVNERLLGWEKLTTTELKKKDPARFWLHRSSYLHATRPGRKLRSL